MIRSKAGWWIAGAPISNRTPGRSFAEYTGNRSEAFWCFDGEMARFTERFSPNRGKLPQIAGVVQDGKVIAQTPDAHFQVRFKLPPLDASMTFRLRGAFLDTVPPGRNPEKWTG